MSRESAESLRASIEIKTEAAQKVHKDHIHSILKYARERYAFHKEGAVMGAVATGGVVALEAIISGQKARILSGLVAAAAAGRTTYDALKAVEFASRSSSLEALELQIEHESIRPQIERSET